MLLRECTQKFLPTAHSFCLEEEDDIGESEGMSGLLECLEESLELTAAERCLGLLSGAACILQTQQNATIVVEKFLDLNISKVKIIMSLKTFERPGSVGWKTVVL